jgi:hypothetical protein
MRPIARLGLPLFSALFLFLLIPASPADAGCRECNQVRRACRVQAALDYVVCKSECPRDDRSVWRSCRQGCRDARSSDRDNCEVQVAECSCDKTDDGQNGDASCARGCTDSLRECFRSGEDGGVKGIAQACRQGCKENATGARDECSALPPSERRECFRNIGLGSCLHLCAQNAAAGVRLCTDALRACLEGC